MCQKKKHLKTILFYTYDLLQSVGKNNLNTVKGKAQTKHTLTQIPLCTTLRWFYGLGLATKILSLWCWRKRHGVENIMLFSGIYDFSKNL